MKKKYKLKDGYNNDVIGYFDTMSDLRRAYNKYDNECEGDWLPLIGKYNPKTGKYKFIEKG